MIQNRFTYYIDRLEGAEITIEGKTCGFLPKSALESGAWYEVTCKGPIVG